MIGVRSEGKLVGVHPDLQKVVRRAFELIQNDNPALGFIVTEGLRTVERQRQLYAARATQTMRSRHITGHAVDLAAMVDGEVRWDWPLYTKIAEVMKRAASELNVPIFWGGDWTSLRDGPHFELTRTAYPAND